MAGAIGVPGPEPEFAIIPQFVSDGAISLDLGANVGLYTYRLSRLSGPTGRVVAFEPFAESASLIRLGARLLGMDNISVEVVAISDREGVTSLVLPKTATGRAVDDPLIHVAGIGESSSIEVPTTTLDQVVKRLALPHITFIKCDVEGAELGVIKGATDTISRFGPVILCEIEPPWTARHGHRPSDVVQLIESLRDYEVRVCEKGRLIPFSRQEHVHSNYFFIPEGQTRSDVA